MLLKLYIYIYTHTYIYINFKKFFSPKLKYGTQLTVLNNSYNTKMKQSMHPSLCHFFFMFMVLEIQQENS